MAGVSGMGGIWNGDNGQVTWRLANLHGDLIATILPGDVGLSATTDASEYGTPRNPEAVGGERYGWLGAKQRATDPATGLILMGVRLYNTTTGRFLTVDPVYGGNANPYDYCVGDPVNCYDLSGRVAPVALVAVAGLGVSVGTVILVIGAAALAALVIYATWYGTRAAAKKLRCRREYWCYACFFTRLRSWYGNGGVRHRPIEIVGGARAWRRD
ncbi:RHS repeat-associated core domain-containing protein [Solwaraspora sp. WMMB335]|uniref:RHS repeat-associated core domain-containing protein n=1 Tax=Solwaraspora sp. WMMB335 TaxID=3404118 RepID=UPI003B96084D